MATYERNHIICFTHDSWSTNVKTCHLIMRLSKQFMNLLHWIDSLQGVMPYIRHALHGRLHSDCHAHAYCHLKEVECNGGL
eukprot:scaffold668103_cov117-Prasinocladus_malaysianus.AAC.1